jgi:chromate transporter
MKPASLRLLSWIFLRYGNLTFGGGTATIAVLDREIIERHKLVRRDQAALSFALARLTPGTNLLAYCSALGWLTRGLPGAILTLVAASLPCSLLVVLATVLYQLWMRQPLFAIAMHGAAAAAVGVMFATGWTILRPFKKAVPVPRFLLLSGGACVLTLAGFPSLPTLLLAAALGCLFPDKLKTQEVYKH